MLVTDEQVIHDVERPRTAAGGCEPSRRERTPSMETGDRGSAIVSHREASLHRQRNLRLGAIDFFAERAIVLQIGSPYFKGTTCFWM